jgi:hypothetical protein
MPTNSEHNSCEIIEQICICLQTNKQETHSTIPPHKNHVVETSGQHFSAACVGTLHFALGTNTIPSRSVIKVLLNRQNVGFV